MSFLLAQAVFTGSVSFDYWLWKGGTERFLSQGDFGLYGEGWSLGGRVYSLQNKVLFTTKVGFDLLQKFVSLEGQGFEARAGSFYTAEGRGLVWATVRDEQVSMDRWLEGAQVKFRKGPLEAEVFSGVKRELYYYNLTDDSTHPARALRVGLSGKPGELGLLYLRRQSILFDTTLTSVYQGGYASARLGPLEVYGEAVKENLSLEELWMGGDSTPDTSALSWYASVNLGFKGFSVLGELKDYHLLANGLNLPPAVNTYGVYATQSLDERGHGLTLRGKLGPASLMAGRYYSADTSARHRVEENTITMDLYTPKLQLKAGFTHALLDSVMEEEGVGYIGRRTERWPRAELTLVGPRGLSLTLGADAWLRRDDTLSYNDLELRLGLGWAPLGTLTLKRQTRSTGGEWKGVEFSAHLSQGLDLLAFYGSQKGQMVCSGGICRYEPEFEGFKVLLLAKF